MNKKMMSIIIVIGIVLIGALTYAFINDSKTKSAPINNSNIQPQNNTAQVTKNVSIENLSFNPSILTVKAGERVMWQDNDSTAHSVVGGALKSSIMNKGEGFSFVFSQPGEYNYHCGIHPSVQGKIIVQ